MKERQIGKYRLLLMDNHGSHLIVDFLSFCQANDILVYTFPPDHPTHFLRSFDGRPFQQYKHYHSKAVNTAARLGATMFDKRHFLFHLPSIRKDAFKPQFIRHSFADRGIYPIKPDILLKESEKQAPTSSALEIYGKSDSPPPEDPSSSQLSSPKNIQRLRGSIQKVQGILKEADSELSAISPS